MAVNVNVVKTGTFDDIVKGAGIIMDNSDGTALTALKAGTITNDKILYALNSSGFNVVVKANTLDWADGVANAPLGMKEYEQQSDWEITASGTAVAITAETVAVNMSFADVKTEGNTKIVTPRTTIDLNDYKDILLAVPKVKENVIVYCLLKNARNQDGFAMQTTDKEKGAFAFNFKAYFSEATQDEVPFEYGEITVAETPAQG